MRTYCTACGAPLPFTAAPEAVNVAGQPAKVGGGIARFLGWGAVSVGMVMALFFAFLGWALSTAVPTAIGGFLLFVSLLVAAPLLFAGRKLRQSGETSELAARERAVLSLAAQQRGVLTVPGVARALGMPDADADALLTTLAKRPDGRVSLEVDDNGNITYMFRDLVAARIATPAARVRVQGQEWRVPAAGAAQPQPKVIDAEFIEEEAAAEADVPARRVTR